MFQVILTVPLHAESDIVPARRRARTLAELLGFDTQDQTRIATSVSEIARNAFDYGGGGQVELGLDARTHSMVTRIQDDGEGISNLPEILDGRYVSQTGMGRGIIGARRLMDEFHIESALGSGTTVVLTKKLPARVPPITAAKISQLTGQLGRITTESPVQEVRRQNQELLQMLEELRVRQEQLHQLNQELEETNRGVLALYAELDDKADRLKHVNDLKSRFLSYMSHEFRTPLNAIQGLTQLLLSRVDGTLTAEQEKQVNFILRSAQELTVLVNDLLDLGKVEAGKVTVHIAEFEVGDLLGTLRGMTRPFHAGNDVELIFEDPVGVATLRSDGGKIAQILRNFISNALKFTPSGQVRVAVRGGPEDTVVFSVADTGIGIEAQDREHIFEEFAQIEGPLQRKVKGTGLGLPLSRKLAQLLGGDVAFTSTPREGSTFTVTLPRLLSDADETPQFITAPTRSAPATAASRPAEEPAPTSKTVLIIDDDEVTRYLLSEFLAQHSLRIIEAKDGVEGVQLARTQTPDLIILDLVMPNLNGYGVLEALSEDAATTSIPVIIHTSHHLEPEAQEKLGQSAVAILRKEEGFNSETIRTIMAAI